MLTKSHFFLSLALLIAMSNVGCPHPGHSEDAESEGATVSRVWTDTSGKQLQGTFAVAREGHVQIRRDDGSLLSLPLSQLADADQLWVAQRTAEINRENNEEPPLILAQLVSTGTQASDANAPAIAKAFEPFVKTKAIRTRWDDRFFYVESKGIPDHQMMVGIRAWQQQVPIPQAYVGNNAWQIPLQPIPAANPKTANGEFLRGAIALAVNGVPIFNPLNNRGDDAYLFGELDEFGGHCGRADDYHYHLAPMHLQKAIGNALPIAYALDGYPIYGFNEPDGSPAKNLDEFNGHTDAAGNYHYHASKKYPYLNGGFHGEVTEREGQVDPQPHANPLRPSLTPLRGAKIVGFEETKPGSHRLTYEINGRKGTITYTLASDGSAAFEFADPNGRKKSETYSPQQRGPGGRDRRPPPPPREDRPLRRDRRPPREPDDTPARESAARPSSAASLEVSSTSVDSDGRVSIDCTCDGKGVPPAVAWKGAPAGTKCFALSLWHIAPDQEKSYWLIYNIPANVTSIDGGSRDVGVWGINDKRKAEYDPMCSKGPGVKTYHVTVFALSKELALDASSANRQKLLEAIKDITLAEGTLDYTYERARR